MDIRFLHGPAIERAIRRLTAEFDELHWAIAWGTKNRLTDEMLAHPKKLKSVTFGLSFCQTDPDLVDSMIDLDGCRVVTRLQKGTYHPKVYAFRSGPSAAAIIGSANFTRGGLGLNHEAAVLLSGMVSDKPLADALQFVSDSWDLGERVSKSLADRYRLSCLAAARSPGPPRDPVLTSRGTDASQPSSSLVRMGWAQYIGAVRGSKDHKTAKSLRVLQTAQGWIAASNSFHDISGPRRKAIAGFLGKRDRTPKTKLDQEWGAFGSMVGAGDFKNRVVENDRNLARAVDSIPKAGDITRAHYDRFVSHFRKAFEHSERQGRVATASRLLAMKRPDTFLCVNRLNDAAAAKQMGFAKTGLTLDNYWDRVVEVIRASEWYNVDKPDDNDGPIWEARAAMLDAIFLQLA